MDKPLIKAMLILAFLISLGYVFVSAFRSLQDPQSLSINVPPPPPPKLIDKPTLPANATPDQVEAYFKLMQQAVSLDKQAVETYTQQVTAFEKDIQARITAAKTMNRDSTARLTAFEKVIKDAIAPIIVTPLLAALLIYSGIKVGADVAMARATAGAQKRVEAP
jgi:hypothetical protein